VGSIETQIAHRLLALTDKRAAAAERAAHRAAAPAPSAAPTDAEEAEEQEEEESDAESDAEGTRGPLPSREQLHALRDGETPLPHTGSFVLRARVACLGGCGEEAFCSAECAAACWEGHHQLLCVGAAGRCEGSALGRFKQHADSTNDAFHVVAQVLPAFASPLPCTPRGTMELSDDRQLVRCPRSGTSSWGCASRLNHDPEGEVVDVCWRPLSTSIRARSSQYPRMRKNEGEAWWENRKND
jgi:hypothetical protein